MRPIEVVAALLKLLEAFIVDLLNGGYEDDVCETVVADMRLALLKQFVKSGALVGIPVATAAISSKRREKTQRQIR